MKKEAHTTEADRMVTLEEEVRQALKRLEERPDETHDYLRGFTRGAMSAYYDVLRQLARENKRDG